MRKLKEIAVVSSLTVVAALGLAACGGSTTASTPVAPTVAPTTAATAMVEQPTAAATAMMEQPTTAPTVMMEHPTSVATAMMAQPTAMSQATTGTGGTIAITGPGADLLTKYTQAFKDVKSYHLTQQIDVSGQSITQEGDFQAPDRTRLVTDLGAAGGKLNTIIIGTKTYQQTPGGDSYTVSDSGSSALNDLRDTSMLQYVDSADIVGDETVNGVASTHLKYVVDSDKMMAQMSQGTPVAAGSGMGKLTIDVWIDKSNNFPVQQKLNIGVNIAGTTTQTATTQTYSKYNETIDPSIEAPKNVTEMPSIPSVEIPTVLVP